MLVFVVPLQSPESSKDWGRVSRLAVRALGSMCAQTSLEFRVILVCNRKPDGMFTHPNLTIIEEPFAVPASDRESRMIDKFTKLRRGFVEARPLAPCHHMLADADDCVSRRLAEWCAQFPDANGWYFKRGYVYDEGTRFAFGRDDFDLLCGTSVIARILPDEMPRSMEEPQKNFFFLTHGHPIVRDSMAQRGTPLEPLPFPGAVYVTGTGENDSGLTYSQWRSRRLLLQKMMNARLLTPGFRREFGLKRLDPSAP